jgi:hypothetical protein
LASQSTGTCGSAARATPAKGGAATSSDSKAMAIQRDVTKELRPSWPLAFDTKTAQAQLFLISKRKFRFML